MSGWIWEKSKEDDWIALCNYIEYWCASEESFWNQDCVRTLISAGKLKIIRKATYKIIDDYHDQAENFGFKNLKNISIFKKASILIELITRAQLFQANESLKLTELEEWCICVCNYRLAWGLAFLYIHQGILTGDKNREKIIDKPVAFPSLHLRCEILEQDTNGKLLVPSRALLLETIAYIYHIDIPRHRDEMTCADGCCDPYFL